MHSPTPFPTQVFRSYDIRGIIDQEITKEFAHLLGRALVARFKSPRVVIGFDARPSSQAFAPYLVEGLTKQGADVVNLGMVPTEMVPITAKLQNISEAIIITASHNPPNYVGFKLLTECGAIAIRDDNGRQDIIKMMQDAKNLPAAAHKGHEEPFEGWNDYVELLCSLVPPDLIQKPLSLLAEAGNGMGGTIVTHLLQNLPITVKPLLFKPDGTYPVHTPNPILPQNRQIAASEAKSNPYDLTVVFDGDADRAAFLDQNGDFIHSDYFDTLIMDEIIHPQFPDSPVVIDYRRGMSTELSANKYRYKTVYAKSGYPNIKQAMKLHNAAFGFEASAHTYYTQTGNAESSGLTLLYLLQILNKHNKPLSEIIAPYRERVKILDERNYHHDNAQAAFETVTKQYPNVKISHDDGLSLATDMWHVNIRTSNTEPLLRLNVEARTDEALLDMGQQIEKLIIESGGKTE
jgi:phosphomannomutase